MLVLISVLRTLVVELSNKGVLDAHEFVTLLQETAIAHRAAGDPSNLADAIHAISEQIDESIPDGRSQPKRRHTELIIKFC